MYPQFKISFPAGPTAVGRRRIFLLLAAGLMAAAASAAPAFGLMAADPLGPLPMESTVRECGYWFILTGELPEAYSYPRGWSYINHDIWEHNCWPRADLQRLAAYHDYAADRNGLIAFFLPVTFFATTVLSFLLHEASVAMSVYHNYPGLRTAGTWGFRLLLGWTLVLTLNLAVSDYCFHPSVRVDAVAKYGQAATLLAAVAATFVAENFNRRQPSPTGYLSLSYFSVVGLLVLSCANDLILMYVGLELVGLSFYVLAAAPKGTTYSTEAGIKYYILGSFSSSVLLLGCSLLYGATGVTNFHKLTYLFFTPPEHALIPLTVLSLGLIGAALLFKLGAAPFHMWSPDVYEGAPTGVSVFFAIVPKVAILILLGRIFVCTFAGLHPQWHLGAAVCAAASVAIGAFGALWQVKVKRLLAYSAIGHVGYLLTAFAAGTPEGVEAAVFYSGVYLVTGAAVWTTVLDVAPQSGRQSHDLSAIVGLYQINPAWCAAFVLLIFSLAGVPPLAGFLSKFLVLTAAVRSGLYLLAGLTLLTGIVSTFYYLRLIKLACFETTAKWRRLNPPTPAGTLVTASATAALFGLFVEPELLRSLGAIAASELCH